MHEMWIKIVVFFKNNSMFSCILSPNWKFNIGLVMSLTIVKALLKMGQSGDPKSQMTLFSLSVS